MSYSSEEMQKLQEGNFHMEKRNNDTHSLTGEELEQEISEGTRLAKLGVDEFRRQALANKLKAQGVDPNTVDLDKILGIKKNELDEMMHDDISVSHNNNKRRML